MPNPDMLAAALHQQLMGPVVLDLPSNRGKTLRLYAHCALDATPGSVAVLALNLAGNAQAVALGNSWQVAPRTEFVLTAPGLASHQVELNGRETNPTPQMLAPDTLRAFGRNVSTATAWSLPPRSAAFAILHAADAKACRR